MQLHELLAPELGLEIPNRSFRAITFNFLVELYAPRGVTLMQLVHILQLLPQTMIPAFLFGQRARGCRGRCPSFVGKIPTESYELLLVIVTTSPSR